MDIQARVAPGELWLRDDLEEVCALLFRFLGIGFLLAMSNLGWHVTRKFVILVPDPTASTQGSLVTSVNTLISGHSLRVLLVTPRNKDDVGDGIPADQLSHNRCECTDSHCNSHIVAWCLFVLPFVPSPITRPPAAEAAQRLRRDEEVLDAPEELRQPVVGVGGAQEEQGQERLALYT